MLCLVCPNLLCPTEHHRRLILYVAVLLKSIISTLTLGQPYLHSLAHIGGSIIQGFLEVIHGSEIEESLLKLDIEHMICSW